MKKAFGIILCAVMILAAAVPAVAIVRNAMSADIVDGKLNIVIGELEEVEALAGDEVDVRIQFKNNTTISSAKILLTYDSKLSVVTEKDKDNNDIPKVTFDIYREDDDSAMNCATLYADKNQLLLNWLTAVGEVKDDAVFATITFKVSEDAKEGDFLAITAEIDPDDVYDIDVNNTEFNLVNGGVKVIAEEESESESEQVSEDESESEPVSEDESEPESEDEPGSEPESDDESVDESGQQSEFEKGDCNEDGEVNNKDVVTLFRYVSSDNKEEDESKYDFNGDNEVNNKDVVELFRYVSKQ